MCFSQRKKYVELVLPLPHNKTLLRNVVTGEVIGEDEVILEKSGPIIYSDYCHYREIITGQQTLRESKHFLTMKADVEAMQLQAQL